MHLAFIVVVASLAPRATALTLGLRPTSPPARCARPARCAPPVLLFDEFKKMLPKDDGDDKPFELPKFELPKIELPSFELPSLPDQDESSAPAGADKADKAGGGQDWDLQIENNIKNNLGGEPENLFAKLPNPFASQEGEAGGGGGGGGGSGFDFGKMFAKAFENREFDEPPRPDGG